MFDLIADQMSHHANHTVATHRHHQERLIVITAPDLEVRADAADDASDLVHVAAGFFGADDVVDLA